MRSGTSRTSRRSASTCGSAGTTRRDLDGRDAVVASPGVPPVAPRSSPGRGSAAFPAWGELELGARLATAPYLAVTGTNGKTTTTGMLGRVPAGRRHRRRRRAATSATRSPTAARRAARRARGRGVVVPARAAVQSFHPRRVGAAQPGARSPRPPRLLRRPTGGEGARSSRAQARRRRPRREPRRHRRRGRVGRGAVRGPVVPRRRAGPTARSGTTTIELVARIGGRVVGLGAVDAERAGYRADAAAAAAAALAFGVDPAAVASGLASFAPAAHRGEVVARVDGVRFLDNSKATNVHAALAAIAGVRDAVLIAGGRAKGQDLAPLGRARRRPGRRGRDRRGGRRGRRPSSRAGCPSRGRRRSRTPSRTAFALATPSGGRAARARVCQLGSVPRLRRARRSVRGGGARRCDRRRPGWLIAATARPATRREDHGGGASTDVVGAPTGRCERRSRAPPAGDLAARRRTPADVKRLARHDLALLGGRGGVPHRWSGS